MDSDVPEIDLDAIEAQLHEMVQEAEEQGDKPESQGNNDAAPPEANENQEQKEQPVPSDEQRSQAQPVKATTGATGAKATASTSGEPSKTIDPDLVKAILDSDKHGPATSKGKENVQPEASVKKRGRKPAVGKCPKEKAATPPKKKQPAPKGPAYLAFKAEQRAVLKEQTPRLKLAEMNRRIAVMWEALPPEEKTSYEEKAKENNENKDPKAEGGNNGTSQKPQKKGGAKRGRKPGAAKKLATDANKQSDGNQTAGSVELSEATRTSDDPGQGNEEEEVSEHEVCDWEKHPVEAIVGTTATHKLIVKRKGLDLTEYGLVDGRLVKRQRLEKDLKAPVSLEMLEEYEAWEQKFKQSVTQSTKKGVLELDEIGQDSPLETCYFLGKMLEGNYPLARIERGKDAAAKFPALGLSMISQRVLDLEKSKRIAAENEVAALQQKVKELSAASRAEE